MKGKFGIVALLVSSITFAGPVSTPNMLNDTPVIGGGSGTCGRVDLTYATSDYMLQPCEEAVIRFTNQQYVPLRIAIPETPSPNQPVVYEIEVGIYNASGFNMDIHLCPNNSAYLSQFISANMRNHNTMRREPSFIIRRSSCFFMDNFGGGGDGPPVFAKFYAVYYGYRYPKHLVGHGFSNISTAHASMMWYNYNTRWYSLGTLLINSSGHNYSSITHYRGVHFISGVVIVRRIL